MKKEKTALWRIIPKAEKEEKRKKQQRMIVDTPSEAKRVIPVSDSEIKEFEKMLDEGLTYAHIEERGFTLTKMKFCIEEINRRNINRKPISVWPVDPKRIKRIFHDHT